MYTGPACLPLIACLLASTGARAQSAADGGTVGVVPGGMIHPLRVGQSPLATNDAMRLRIRSLRQGPSSIQDIYVRVGAVHVPAGWTVTACIPDCAAFQTVQTITLQGNAWNQVTFSPPLNLPAGSDAEITFEPQAPAEADFISNFSGPSAAQGSPRLGKVPWADDFSLAMEFHSGSTWSQSGVVFVFTLAGELDALAPAACQGADRIAVEGRPYLDTRLVPSTNGSLAQTFFRLPYSAPSAAEELEGLHIYSISPIPFTLSGPSIPTRSGTFDGGYGALANCLPTEPWSSALELDTLTVQPPPGGTFWYLAIADFGSLPLCHPVARATFGGSAASAVLSGVANPAWDVVFGYDTQPLKGWYLDADGDGHGAGPLEGYCLNRMGYVPNSDDCDDTRAQVYPGAPETCDGLDNGCDGAVDGEDPDLVLDLCPNQQGVCGGSLHVASECQNGGWTTCAAQSLGSGFETTEGTCDGLDNDCDGKVDEALPPPLCPKQDGVCEGATAPGCVAGHWAACSDSSYGHWYEPAERSCDGLDNDCDGLVDGLDPDVIRPLCTLQLGVCDGARAGVDRCGVDGWAGCAAEDYGPRYETVESSCDGLDNDCDGWLDQYDPDLVAAPCENQLGVCKGSVHAAAECGPSGWSACTAADFAEGYVPDEHVCDGLDNDCDGTIDEGCGAGLGCAVPGRGGAALGLWVLLAAAAGRWSRQFRRPAG